jgi:hypothetical protein
MRSAPAQAVALGCRITAAPSRNLGRQIPLETGKFPRSGSHPGSETGWRLDGTHASSVGSPPDLVDIGPGTNAFATEVVNGVSRTVLTFPMGNGLSLSPVSSLIPRDHYTIAMRFGLDVIDYNRRLIDFFDGQSDCGVYDYFGHLIVYCGAEGSGSMLAGTWVEVVLTRDTAGNVAGYVDGAPRLSFVDDGHVAVVDANDTLRFFRDNECTAGACDEDSAGAVARIRLWDDALTADEVAALYPCAAAPLVSCRTPMHAHASVLVLRDWPDDPRDTLVWRWASGAATTAADLGDPTAGSDYRLCLYDAAGDRSEPLLRATARARGTCAGAPCWKPTSSGFKYTDPELTPDGLHVVQLEAGGDGRAKIVVKGRGANLHMPGLGLFVPVTVQLHRADGDPCWGATFLLPSRNAPGRFKTRSQ